MEIRNFAIIAHIDHGKSTLADRLLEKTGTVKVGSGQQMLDTMPLEQEKGITIKLNPARMFWSPKHSQILNPKSETLNKSQIENSKNENNLEFRVSDLEFANSVYQLNLIDTPGHVDFGYEVSRSLAAVEGVLLLVDASQGIQAQTLTNLHQVKKLGLKIIPVVNKIDLPTAQLEDTAEQVTKLLDCDLDDILFVSGKTGEGVDELLNAIIDRVPAPHIEENSPLRALVFDSFFDQYLGAVAYVKIVSGSVKKQQRIKLLATNAVFDCVQTGYMQIKRVQKDLLEAGEIGYIATGLKSVKDCRVGDTISSNDDNIEPLPGYKTPKPMIYASFFPEPGEERLLNEALDKLQLNDAALEYDPVNSKALGPGFNIGFLGLLHMEIVKERLGREFDVSVLVTSPTVAYKLDKDQQEEPWVNLEIVCPHNYYGAVSELASHYRTIFKNTEYIGDRVISHYEAPLAEIIVEFYDRLKSVTAGYASMDYNIIGYREADLVAVDLLIAGDNIDAFTQHMVRSKADRYGRAMVKKLKDLIPKQNFEISLQAAIGGKIIARETISAFRKDVTAKLYGGDVTRKNKLLEKQKKGKKKMRNLGRVEIPNQVFIDLLKQ